MGVIDDDDFPQVLADLRTTVSEEDLPEILEAAFGRNPDGTAAGRPQASQPLDAQGDKAQGRVADECGV
ncbi:hypothetical protein [Streptomyces sp. PA5.6]|uniref:hypothetical protein n=1 Tax=Streptomyces sp. PA5.6 TaxID=3035651 RepID=UPI0039049C41